MSKDTYSLEKYKSYPEIRLNLDLDARSRYRGFATYQEEFDGEVRTFFEAFNPEEWPKFPEDILWEVESGYEKRPDLISYKFYNTVKLWWLICQINNLDSPFEGFETEQVIRIPALDSILNYIYRRIP